MAKICPQCGREFENSRIKCAICKIDLVSDGIDNSERARMERLERLRQQQPTVQNAQARTAQMRTQQQARPTVQARGKTRTALPEKDGPSGLSITALGFSLLGCLSVVGLVLGIVDLCINKHRKKVCSVLSLIFAGLWIIGMTAFFSGNSGSSSKSPSIAGNSKNTFGLMETAQSNGVKVTMTKYEESAGSEWNNPSSGNIFVLTEFEIENNSNSELAISSVLSFDAYVDNYTANYSLGALLEKSNETTLDGTIAAGMKMRGWIGWEVPSDWEKIEVHFKADVWSGNAFKFLIKK